VRDNPRVIASYLGTDERAINRSGATGDLPQAGESVEVTAVAALRIDPNPA
jgi:hypothetical protein